MTAVAGAVFAAADFNTYVRDNLNMTAPAIATAANQYFVATAANAIAARLVTTAAIATSQTTTSSTYADLATVGPSVTLTTGTLALVVVTSATSNSVTNATCFMSYAVTGATVSGAANNRALRFDGLSSGNVVRASSMSPVTLTAGSNTFTAKYAVGAGSTGTFVDRSIIVIPF
jgi:hypothetical protein